MEPIPETTEAVNEFGPFWAGEGDMLDQLRARGSQVRAIVPACVGLSIGSIEHGVTLTMVASDAEIAALDGVQYLHGGPCVEAVKAERVLDCNHGELLAEPSWQQFALATAASGIASTLTLPILVSGEVGGSVNLYAASTDAFTGHHEAIAEIFDAWAPGAVANADLSFRTREIAELAPQILLDEMSLQVALGMIMSTHGVDADEALQRLREAAHRAGLRESELARKLIESARSEDSDR